MTLKLQIIIIVGMILAILLIFRLISSKKLNFKLGLSWVLVSLVLMAFAIWPQFLKAVSDLLGIYDPVNMLFMFGFVLLVLIIVSLSIEVSKLAEQNKRLAQELAILRKDTYKGNGVETDAGDNDNNTSV